MAKLSAITIYPIKSCGGIALDQAGIGTLGLALDRHWMLVDDQGQFLTQRSRPAMACIVPRFEQGELVVSAPGMPELRLPGAGAGAGGDEVAVTVWKDNVIALEQGAQAHQWFSAYLGIGARLVRFKPDAERVCSIRWTEPYRATTQFSDGYPLLVIGQASLDDLNARLTSKGAPALPMERFRPNLVIEGLEAYEEDFIDTIRLGRGDDVVELKMVKPCARCPVPGIDQQTGLRDPQWPDEPLDTLAVYRASPRVGGGLTFGQNAIVSRSGAEIHVGQECSWELNF